MEHEENSPAQSLVERQVQALTTSVQDLTRQNQISCNNPSFGERAKKIVMMNTMTKKWPKVEPLGSI